MGTLYDGLDATQATPQREYLDTQQATYEQKIAAAEAERDAAQRRYDAHMATHTPDPPSRPAPDAVEKWDAGWDTRWYVASGGKMAKVNQQGLRIPYNVVVADGKVTVHVRKTDKAYTIEGTTIPKGSWSAGLMQSREMQYTHGKWEFDVSMSPGRGGRMVTLLWPCGTSPGWPKGGELDAPENGDDRYDCKSTAIANHWANASGAHQQRVVSVKVDLTRPVRVGYRWSKDRLVVEFDGAEAARFTDNIPPGPMQLCIQTATAKGGWGDTFTDASGRTVQRQPCALTVGPVSYWADPDG